MKNFDQKLQVLKENFKHVEGEISLKDYVLSEAGSDPNFYRWFFGVELDMDFDTSLTDEQREEFSRFLEAI